MGPSELIQKSNDALQRLMTDAGWSPTPDGRSKLAGQYEGAGAVDSAHIGGHQLAEVLRLALVKIVELENQLYYSYETKPGTSDGSLLWRIKALEASVGPIGSMMKVAEDRMKEIGLTFESVAQLEVKSLREQLEKYRKAFAEIQEQAEARAVPSGPVKITTTNHTGPE